MTQLIIAYALNIFDYIMTERLVNKFGADIERNPIGRWMFERDVAWAFKIFFVGAVCAALAYFIHRYPKYSWTAYIPLGVYGLLAVYHVVLALKVWWITK